MATSVEGVTNSLAIPDSAFARLLPAPPASWPVRPWAAEAAPQTVTRTKGDAMHQALVLLATALLFGLVSGKRAREKDQSPSAFFAFRFFVLHSGLAAAGVAMSGIVGRAKRNHDIAEAREESERRRPDEGDGTGSCRFDSRGTSAPMPSATRLEVARGKLRCDAEDLP